MQKVQTGLVIEFYSNSCLVRTDKKDIPCIGIKDIIVGDVVEHLNWHRRYLTAHKKHADRVIVEANQEGE